MSYAPPLATPVTNTPTAQVVSFVAAADLPLPHAGLAALTGGQVIRHWLAAERRYWEHRRRFLGGVHLPIVVRTPPPYFRVPNRTGG